LRGSGRRRPSTRPTGKAVSTSAGRWRSSALPTRG
jgi:hypothetical protein